MQSIQAYFWNGFAKKLVCAMLFACFCGITTAAEATPIVKVMSFNVRADFDFGTPSSNANAWISTSGNDRRDLATAVINDYGPDVLGVQEAFLNQVNDLSGTLTDYGFYGVGREDGGTAGEYSGIYYRDNRFTQSDQGTFWLSLTPDTPSFYPGTTFRIASWVILQDSEADNREYFILNTHWAQGFGGTVAREYSADLVRDRIDLLAGDRPVVVMGDLNAFDFQPAYLNLLGQNSPEEFQLHDSYRENFPVKGPNERTNHGFLGHIDGQRLDYILHTSDFRADAATIVHTSYEGSFPSDHYPVTASLFVNHPGDFDSDDDVDGSDFLTWQQGLSRTPKSSNDLLAWRTNYGHQTVPFSAFVPEPSTATLLCSGCFLIGLLRLPRR